MDLKWQMAMLSVRVHKFEQKAGRKIDFDKKESARVWYDCGCDTGDAIEEGAYQDIHLITGADTKEPILQVMLGICYHRFAKADSMKAVPPPLSRDYTPLSDHIDLDESQMSYGTKSSTSGDSNSSPSQLILTLCINSSVSTSESKAEIESNVGTPIQEPIIGNPYSDAEDEGIFYSGCSRSRITRKGRIRTPTLDFENVYYVKELQQFNLFSISQICDKNNRVLFTDTDCLVLSNDFKLPDESMVLLRVLRKHNLYTFNLNNLAPKENLACLVAKASSDEAVKWHRRMGHVNYKNMNKLVKDNLVRGLPPKLFKNDHLCCCLQRQQHKLHICCGCKLLWSGYSDIEFRHYFIRDANEKKLIQVLKIHTDDNVADLLTKAFDGPRFNHLVVNIGMLNP
ncbi:ribonuclease H-like domain-containing protein [Tanacetum coccineum]|uniref:Ribonuclease H-like domain-containing protein n=1 Tax=Tanacetum coccineum TaxID=301880 RepID=A0ABQ5ALB5_9ASTR